MPQFCMVQLCGLGSALLKNCWAVREDIGYSQDFLLEKKKNEDTSEIVETLVAALGLRERYRYEKVWNAEKKQQVKNW